MHPIIQESRKNSLVCLGGLFSRCIMEQALQDGFEFIGMARPLINDPAFVNKMKKAGRITGMSEAAANTRTTALAGCTKPGRRYTTQHVKNIPKRLLDEFK